MIQGLEEGGLVKNMTLLLGLLLVLPRAVAAEPYPLAGHWEGAVARLGSVQTIQVANHSRL
jgi:hypothetical protein